MLNCIIVYFVKNKSVNKDDRLPANEKELIVLSFAIVWFWFVRLSDRHVCLHFSKRRPHFWEHYKDLLYLCMVLVEFALDFYPGWFSKLFLQSWSHIVVVSRCFRSQITTESRGSSNFFLLQTPTEFLLVAEERFYSSLCFIHLKIRCIFE